ncbi:hypothetical protein HDV63DRAFT_360290, partial [Trichoderma sp. SZMC 28014]
MIIFFLLVVYDLVPFFYLVGGLRPLFDLQQDSIELFGLGSILFGVACSFWNFVSFFFFCIRILEEYNKRCC